MFKRMLPWVIMIFVVITLIVFAAFLLWNYLFNDTSGQDPSMQAKESVNEVEGSKMSAREIKELSVEMNDVLTNLSTGEFIKVSFTFELSNTNAKEEFQLIDFKIKAIVIQTLADLTPDQVRGSQGNDFISTTLLNKVNQIMDKGKARHVNITNFVIS